MTQRTRSERIAIAVLGVVLVLWVLGALVDPAVYFQPILFGLGTGAIIASLALGLVVAYRASGVINFGHGAIATYVAYVYVSLRDDGEYPIPPLPNPVAPIEGIFGIEILDFPTFISLGEGLGKPAALTLALLTAALLGLIAHLSLIHI